MTKLCPRGKAAAKRKFKVYPSAYANAYASKICAGKIKDPSGVKRKDFRGRKPAAEGGPIENRKFVSGTRRKEIRQDAVKPRGERKKIMGSRIRKPAEPISAEKLNLLRRKNTERRKKMMGGGLMEATARLKRQGLKEGGGADTGRKGNQRSKLITMLSRYTAKTRGSKRAEKMGGGMMRPMYQKGGKVARGCGAIMSDRSKKTKTF